MPMPHCTQMQLIKRRLLGKEGSERTHELRAILTELSGYRNGPYADLRKWVQSRRNRWPWRQTPRLLTWLRRSIKSLERASATPASGDHQFASTVNS